MNFRCAFLLLLVVLWAGPIMAEDAVLAAENPVAQESATKGDNYNKAERQKKNEQTEELIHQSKSGAEVTEETLESNTILTVEPVEPVVAKSESVSINIQELPGIALDSTGLTDRGITLGTTMWQNTPHGLAIRLVSGLPMAIESPAVRSLALRLLLTAAEQPKKNSSMELGDQLLIDQRLVKLWNMGQWVQYGNLLATMPSAAITGNLAKNYALLQLIVGQPKGGCERVDKFSRTDNPDRFWQKAQIYCAMLSDKEDMARLMHDLWQEKYGNEDPVLHKLLDAAESNARDVKVTAKDLSTLHWLIVNHADLIVNTEGIDTVDVAAQILLLSNENILWQKKAVLAEKLALQGVIDSAQLTRIYDQLAANGNAGKKLLRKESQKISAAQRRGSNWMYTHHLADPIQHASAISDSYEDFDAASERRLLALAHADWLKSISPSTDFAWFAPTAGRLFVLLGDIKSARAWFEMAATDESAAAKSWPYLRVLHLGEAQSRIWAEKWVARIMLSSPRKVEEYLGLLAMNLRGLGESDDVLSRNFLPNGFSAEMLKLISRKTAPAGLSVLLQQAVQTASRAEAVAYIIYMLGQFELAEMSPQNIAQAIDSLYRLGLQDEARAVALESLAASGI